MTPSVMRLDAPGRRAAIFFTAAVIVFGLYVRFAGLRDVFCHSPDELAEVMPGLRLHGLPFFNFRDPIRYNFIQSAFYSQHGLGDVSFYYLASGALSLVGLPVSERSLFAVAGVTNLAFAAAGCILAASLIESILTGWVFALLVLVSPFYVFVSKTGWGRLSWTPLIVILALLCQQRALTSRSRIWAVVYWVLALFASLTDAFIMM